jgi:hypothetical protein
MEDDDVEVEVITVEPKLHDRWSLLLLAVTTAAEVTQVIANNLATASMMMAQHTRQKHYDRKFREITR